MRFIGIILIMTKANFRPINGINGVLNPHVRSNAVRYHSLLYLKCSGGLTATERIS